MDKKFFIELKLDSLKQGRYALLLKCPEFSSKALNGALEQISHCRRECCNLLLMISNIAA